MGGFDSIHCRQLLSIHILFKPSVIFCRTLTSNLYLCVAYRCLTSALAFRVIEGVWRKHLEDTRLRDMAREPKQTMIHSLSPLRLCHFFVGTLANVDSS